MGGGWLVCGPEYPHHPMVWLIPLGILPPGKPAPGMESPVKMGIHWEVAGIAVLISRRLAERLVGKRR